MGEGSKTNNKKLLEYLQHLRFSILKHKDNAPDLFQDIPTSFDKLLNIISQRLARIPGLRIEAELEICLRMITHFFDMDRTSLFKINEEDKNIEIIASYTRPGLGIKQSKVDFGLFPRIFDALLNQKAPIFLKEHLQALQKKDPKHPFNKIKAGYLIPIQVTNKVNYIFGSVILVDRKKTWDDEIIELQKSIALVMAHAISIHNHERELVKLENNWKRKFNTIVEAKQKPLFSIDKDISSTTINEHWIYQAIIELGDSGTITEEKILTRIGRTSQEFQQLFPDLENSSGIERFKSDVINEIYKTLSKVLDHIEPMIKNMPPEIGITETLDYLADYYFYLKALAKINTESKERSVKRITGIIHYRLENYVYAYLEKLFEGKLIDAYEMDGIKDAIVANFYYQSIFTDQRRWITSLKRFPHNLSYLLNAKNT